MPDTTNGFTRTLLPQFFGLPFTDVRTVPRFGKYVIRVPRLVTYSTPELT